MRRKKTTTHQLKVIVMLDIEAKSRTAAERISKDMDYKFIDSDTNAEIPSSLIDWEFLK